jgi:serine phosphatase RsbU (regulator of sigma subunit)
MTITLRKLPGIILLFMPLMVFSQTRIIVYDGITGIDKIQVQNDTVHISSLLPKSPAQRDGLLYRDQLIQINDSSVAGRGLGTRDIKSLLYGSSQEPVDLKIKRKGEDSLRTFTILRDPYLYQITAFEFVYLVDSLEQWDIRDVMSESMDSLFANPLIAKCQVYSVEEGSPASEGGILAGDQVISLAEEMDKEYYHHIGSGTLSTATVDTSISILRDDSILHFSIEPNAENFKGITSVFTKDLETSCVWLKIKTENRLSENRTYVINFPWMQGKDSVNFYIPGTSGKVLEKRSGISIPTQYRDYIYKDWYAILVPLAKGEEQTFYIRWKAEEEVGAPLMHIIAHKTIVDHNRVERMILSGFLGMMLIISIFFLFLYFAIRGRQYVYFSLYIFCLGLFFFVSEGYPGEYYWNTDGFLMGNIPDFQPYLISLASIFFLLLGITYLDLKKSFIWLYRSVLIGIAMIGIRMFTILLEALFNFEIQGTLEAIIIIVWAVAVSIIPLFILILPAIMRIREGYRPAWYFLIANAVLIPFAIITISRSEYSFTFYALYESVLGRIVHVSGVYVAAVFQMLIFSFGLAQKMNLDEKEKKLAQQRIIDQMKENEKLKDKVNRELEQKVRERTREIHEQKDEIEAQRDEIEAQRDLVFNQKKEITDSISYAQRIQAAVLPHKEYMDDIMSEYFVFFKPRDIVSGDFYWIKEVNSSLIVVAADCTGHGVPGAVMSMLGIALLNEQLGKSWIDRPGEILGQLRSKVKEMLVQQGNIRDQKDGMDMAIAILDKEKMELQFAGANQSLYLVRPKDGFSGIEPALGAALEGKESLLFELKGDKQPIGVHWEERDFSNQTLQLQQGDSMYLFTDGYVDQFGGEMRKKFKTARFKELLLSVQAEPMAVQKQTIENTFESWRGNLEQIDDVCVIGVRI